VLPLTASTLEVSFSESVAQGSAESTANYTVTNGIGNPFSAVRDATDKSLVHLSFSGSFTSGILYTLATSNLPILAGNALAANTANDFTYYQTSTPVPGDCFSMKCFLMHAPAGGVR
jgi:hypothetical protein